MWRIPKNMNEKFQIVPEDKPEESAWGIIGRGVQNFNIEQTKDSKFQRLCFVLQDSNNETVGGILGEVYWGWFYIDLLWVEEELRGQGYGQRLLEIAEKEARKHGAKHAYLDTFSFQAPDFYKRYGYKVFGELQNFPPGHQRYFMTKQL